MHIRYNQAGYTPQQKKRIVILSDHDISEATWRICNAEHAIICSGSVPPSIQGKTKYTTKPYNYEIDFSDITSCGNYSFSIDNSEEIHIRILENPYSSFPLDILSTIRARRSGSHDAIIHAFSHGGDAACPVYMREQHSNRNWKPSSSQKTVNMLGGWYDAGDYIKFTHTIAYTTYFLLKAYEQNPHPFIHSFEFSKTDLNDVLDEAKWGLDFLMKTMPEKDLFIIQVGGHADHEQGERLPEHDSLDGARECYAALSQPQMGLTAAALALGARLFAQTAYSQEAQEYETKACEIYAAAKQSTEPPAWFESDIEVYYADATAHDNMELAAVELYVSTGKDVYKQDAISFVDADYQALWASWADVAMHAHALLIPHHQEILPVLQKNLSYFNAIAHKTGNLWHSPHKSTWGTLYSYFSVANCSYLYKQASGLTEFDSVRQQVLDYLFGINPWGIAFIASQQLPHSITSTYALLYRLQADIFPRGEIAEGPTTREMHEQNQYRFIPPHNPNLWHKEFNTDEYTFFEQAGDYVCMETTITGLADGFFLLAVE